jgi:hypothetical protein
MLAAAESREGSAPRINIVALFILTVFVWRGRGDHHR